jgi:hypothetical protein
MALRWTFSSHTPAAPIPADFLNVTDRECRRQLEKSCERQLPFRAGSNAADGEAVREFYLSSVDLQTRYPLGLLPVGQKRLAKWLLKQGKAQHEFSDEQVVAFLRAAASDLPRGIAETYLVTVEWQERFPSVRAAAEQERLLEYLREQYPGWNALGSVVAAAVVHEHDFAAAGDRQRREFVD